jgi:hypothetical protein
MGPRNAYKDMLDNVVSPITCVSMNHENQLEQMANGAMFATKSLTIGSLICAKATQRRDQSRSSTLHKVHQATLLQTSFYT